MASSNQHRTTTTYRINPKIAQRFYDVCKQRNLLFRGHFNVALEGLMDAFCDKYEPKSVVQVRLDGPEPLKRKKQLGINQRLELKMVKADLSSILEALEQKRGHADFRMQRFREVLPRAIRLFEETRDSEIEALLGEAEKWV